MEVLQPIRPRQQEIGGSQFRQQTSPRKIPWLPLSSLLAVVLCMGASAALIVLSDHQAVASWMVQPSVLLSILAGLSNIALGFAFSEAVVATWWTRAANGASLKELHHIWKRGEGFSFFSALAAGPAARTIARTMFVVVVIKVAAAPLLQKATHPEIQQRGTTETIMLNVAQSLPLGWTGFVRNATAIVGSGPALQVTQAWWDGGPIIAPNSTCQGNCTGKIRGAGIRYRCSSTTQAIGSLLDNSTLNGPVLFEISTSMSSDPSGTPYLLLTTKHTSAIDDNCFATITIDNCMIDNAIVDYPVTLLNKTISLDPQRIVFISTHPDSNSATEGSPAGTLQGLDYFANNFYAVATRTGPNIFSGDLMARLYVQVDKSAYSSVVFDNCALLWISPTGPVLNAMNEFMFRASLSAATYADSQSIAVLQTRPTLIFRSVYAFLAVAAAITLWGVFRLILLQGWSLRRTVSLSPLETANAFRTPLMARTRYSNTTVDGILSDMGQVKVKYDGVVMVVDDNSTGNVVEHHITHF